MMREAVRSEQRQANRQTLFAQAQEQLKYRTQDRFKVFAQTRSDSVELILLSRALRREAQEAKERARVARERRSAELPCKQADPAAEHAGC